MSGNLSFQKIVFTEKERAELIEASMPASPLGDHEIMGSTLCSLISPGTELAMYRNGPDDGQPMDTGYASVFQVESVGHGVTDIKAGDLVYFSGKHQSIQRTTRENVLLLPSGLSPKEAVLARLLGVTMTTLSTTKARPPQKVLITGLGPVGYLATQVFAKSGYEVLACDPVEWRRELARKAGIKHVWSHLPTEDRSTAGTVALVVECSGHEQAVLDGCKMVCKNGEVVIVGTPWQKKTEISAHDLLKEVFFNYVTLRSGWEWNLPAYPDNTNTNSLMGNIKGALDWLSDNQIVVDGIYETVSPHHAREIYQNLMLMKQSSLLTIFDWKQGQSSSL